MNVLIIDNQDIFVKGVTYGLKEINDNYCVYGLSPFEELNKNICKLNFSAVIIDGDINKLNLLNILLIIKEKYPYTPIIFTTDSNKSYNLVNYRDFYVSAIIRRKASIEDIHHVLMVTKSGIRCVSQDILITELTKQRSILSKRKEDILLLILNGFTNKQIARKLDISPGTVKSHIESILLTLNVHSRIKAATTYFSKENLH